MHKVKTMGRVSLLATIAHNVPSKLTKAQRATIERNSKPHHSRAARAKRDARLTNFW